MAYVPGQRARYKTPRKITPAKVLLVAALVAAVYFGSTFIPPYYAHFRASSIMKDESAKAYSRRHQDGGWSKVETDIHRRVRDRLLGALKIPSEQLTVRVKKMPKSIVITADWSVHVKWPFVGKTTRMTFKEKITTSLR